MPILRLPVISTGGIKGGWYKKFVRINEGERGSWAFQGAYLKANVDIEFNEGDLILSVKPVGSMRHGSEEASLYEIKNGELSFIQSFDWRREFDKVMAKGLELIKSKIKT